jgi:hypothetical protein
VEGKRRIRAELDQHTTGQSRGDAIVDCIIEGGGLEVRRRGWDNAYLLNGVCNVGESDSETERLPSIVVCEERRSGRHRDGWGRGCGWMDGCNACLLTGRGWRG